MALGGLFELDRMAQVLKVVTLLTVAVVFVYSTDYLRRRSILKGEYYVLGLFATLGGMVLISAASLITLYLGLELMSLCLYAMVAFDRESGIAAESAIKYFVLGSMASGTLLYGMSIVYGVTGSLELPPSPCRAYMAAGRQRRPDLRHRVPDRRHRLQARRRAVPYVDPGRVRGFAHLRDRVHRHGVEARGLCPRHAPAARGAAAVAAATGARCWWCSRCCPSRSATSSRSRRPILKRMLAYSTISHIGYVLLGILSGTAQGYQAAMFYMISYVIVAAGAFGMILLLARQGFEADKLADFKGLTRAAPGSPA